MPQDSLHLIPHSGLPSKSNCSSCSIEYLQLSCSKLQSKHTSCPGPATRTGQQTLIRGPHVRDRPSTSPDSNFGVGVCLSMQRRPMKLVPHRDRAARLNSTYSPRDSDTELEFWYQSLYAVDASTMLGLTTVFSKRLNR